MMEKHSAGIGAAHQISYCNHVEIAYYCKLLQHRAALVQVLSVTANYFEEKIV
jgi:hypothetical protein